MECSNYQTIRSIPPSKNIVNGRGAESWWGCSDSGSDSELLIDSDSYSDSDYDSDSGSDVKYKISNTLIVKRVSAVQAKKKRALHY